MKAGAKFQGATIPMHAGAGHPLIVSPRSQPGPNKQQRSGSLQVYILSPKPQPRLEHKTITPTLGGTTNSGSIQLHTPGPFNHLVVLLGEVVKKILNMELVDMAKISLKKEPKLFPGCLPPPKRLPVKNISQWLEKFSLMAATLVTRFPHKAAELFKPQSGQNVTLSWDGG